MENTFLTNIRTHTHAKKEAHFVQVFLGVQLEEEADSDTPLTSVEEKVGANYYQKSYYSPSQ